MDNSIKQAAYAKYKASLKKALHSEFWLQSIFIEYAILEDRLESVLAHQGSIKLTNSRNQPLKISEKLNKIAANPAFTDPKIRKYLSLELTEAVRAWKQQRDAAIHALMKSLPDDEAMKELALEGEKLVKLVESRVKSVNRIFDKANTTA